MVMWGSEGDRMLEIGSFVKCVAERNPFGDREFRVPLAARIHCGGSGAGTGCSPPPGYGSGHRGAQTRAFPGSSRASATRVAAGTERHPGVPGAAPGAEVGRWRCGISSDATHFG